MGEITRPKDQMKTHRHAASRSQFSDAHMNADHSVRRLFTSMVMRSATLAIRALILSGLTAGFEARSNEASWRRVVDPG